MLCGVMGGARRVSVMQLTLVLEVRVFHLAIPSVPFPIPAVSVAISFCVHLESSCRWIRVKFRRRTRWIERAWWIKRGRKRRRRRMAGER